MLFYLFNWKRISFKNFTYNQIKKIKGKRFILFISSRFLRNYFSTPFSIEIQIVANIIRAFPVTNTVDEIIVLASQNGLSGEVLNYGEGIWSSLYSFWYTLVANPKICRYNVESTEINSSIPHNSLLILLYHMSIAIFNHPRDSVNFLIPTKAAANAKNWMASSSELFLWTIANYMTRNTNHYNYKAFNLKHSLAFTCNTKGVRNRNPPKPGVQTKNTNILCFVKVTLHFWVCWQKYSFHVYTTIKVLKRGWKRIRNALQGNECKICMVATWRTWPARGNFIWAVQKLTGKFTRLQKAKG